MASTKHLESIAAAQALEAKLLPDFQAKLDAMKLPDLKAFASECRAYTRGAKVRKDWERAILRTWRAEVWHAAGYRYGTM